VAFGGVLPGKASLIGKQAKQVVDNGGPVDGVPVARVVAEEAKNGEEAVSDANVVLSVAALWRVVGVEKGRKRIFGYFLNQLLPVNSAQVQVTRQLQNA